MVCLFSDSHCTTWALCPGVWKPPTFVPIEALHSAVGWHALAPVIRGVVVLPIEVHKLFGVEGSIGCCEFGDHLFGNASRGAIANAFVAVFQRRTSVFAALHSLLTCKTRHSLEQSKDCCQQTNCAAASLCDFCSLQHRDCSDSVTLYMLCLVL